MRMFKRVAIVATLAGLVIGPVAGTTAASASTATRSAQVRLTGGETTVTTAPGIATTLLGNGIVPIATLPGTQGAQLGGVAVRFAFPVTGGWLNTAKLTGTIWHKGGILFADLPAGKQIAVSDFVINVHQGVLTGAVNGNPKVRAPLFQLNLAHATIHQGRHYVQIRGIVLTLTSTAASALNSTFGTSLFQPGLKLGTAGTVLRF
jgi:hypothetical protein